MWRKKRAADDDAARARDEAEQNLAEAHKIWPEVRQVSSSLRELTQRNHFAEQIEQIFRANQPPSPPRRGHA